LNDSSGSATKSSFIGILGTWLQGRDFGTLAKQTLHLRPPVGCRYALHLAAQARSRQQKDKSWCGLGGAGTMFALCPLNPGEPLP
jgi:hypothetical protein